jgi:type VI secretion system protein ImpH
VPLDLKRVLGKEATSLNFFQAVYLIERLFAGKGQIGTADELRREPVRFETHNTLSFPPGEIAALLPPLSLSKQLAEAEQVRAPGQAERIALEYRQRDSIAEAREHDAPLRFEATFMGLYGVSSPLPSYFIDPITLRKVEYFQLKKFLDIFGHRVYSLFYRAWKKYRHPLQFQDGGADDFTQRLVGLTGQWPATASSRRPRLPPPGQTAEFRAANPMNASGAFGGFPGLAPADLRRIAYARFLGSRVRSAKGLEQLLRGYFGFTRVRVFEFVKQRVPIPVPAALGSPMSTLGPSLRIGETMEDRMGRFEVEIGPLPAQDLHRFMPPGLRATTGKAVDFSQGLAREVRELIDAYLRDPFDYGITVIIHPATTSKMGLGESESLLGMGTYLGGQSDKRLLRLRP